MLLYLLLLLLLDSGLGRDGDQDAAISSFLAEREAWDPMCLYTFSNSTHIRNWVPGDRCPFGDLQPDSNLVTSSNTAKSYWQLGVRLVEDARNDSTHVQLSSSSSVSAREFFTMSAVRNQSVDGSGVTFELVLRRTTTNQSMTLFSIANEYDECADPGFRLDINQHQVLVFVYFLPIFEEGSDASVEACYEQRLFSVDGSSACQLPPLADPIENTPPVHIIVTLDPSSQRGLWKTDFYLSYTDIETMERVNCEAHDEQHPPTTQVLSNLIQGRYQLFLGNSPRNVSSPRQRKRFASAREFGSLPNANYSMNTTERLRVMLKQKLDSISGPRLPKAMRIFGDKFISLHVLGISFPPLTEDTPLAFLRSKIADFKEQYGDQIVDYLVRLVQKKNRGPIATSHDQGSLASSRGQSSLSRFGKSSNPGEFSRASLFQGAGGANFDLFHFAIYRRVVSAEQVAGIARQWLIPARQFPSWHQTIRIPEDSVVELDLTLLHGVFNDIRLELRGVPEFGQLSLLPNKTVVTKSNLQEFRRLPLKFQHKTVFRPGPDQNNENLPLPNPVAFSRRLKPYATIAFGIAESLAGRDVNRNMTAQIDIYVDAVNDAPRPQQSKTRMYVKRDTPVLLELEGNDVDGAPSTDSTNSSSSAYSPSLCLSGATTEPTRKRQELKVIRTPTSGKLFDCNASCGELVTKWRQGLESLESDRIFRNSTDGGNATHSTNLLYVYHGWRQDDVVQDLNMSSVVDELHYQLSDGDLGIFSDVVVAQFALERTKNGNVAHDAESNVIAVVQLYEDSLRELNLADMDPLSAFFNSQTRFEVTRLPVHGSLHQYQTIPESQPDDPVNHKSTNVSLANVGRHITTSCAVVADPLGRIIYAPNLDYFNFQSQYSFDDVADADFFEYRILNAAQPRIQELQVHNNSPATLFADRSKTRKVEMEVVNVPDALVVLPPLVFKAKPSDNGTIPTPVVFKDPDSSNSEDQYQVNLQAEDGTFELQLGFAITDKDVMTECPFERPCTLNRSTDGAYLNDSSIIDSDFVLHFHIATQLYDPSHVQVSGTKPALDVALSALTVHGYRANPWATACTTTFTLLVKRIGIDNGSDHAMLETQTHFTVVLSATSSAAGANILSKLNSQLQRYVWTIVIVVLSCIVITNASCFSVIFCCCCCSNAKRRERFEQRQRAFQAQVVQNDPEYSILLMSLASLLLEPNLLVTSCLLKSCMASDQAQSTSEILIQAFTLRSLFPVLESGRQGVRLVFQLMANELETGITTVIEDEARCQHRGFLKGPSTASRALAHYCRAVGSNWISTVIGLSAGGSDFYRGHAASELDTLLDRLSKQITALPVEIVILCRACAKLPQKMCESDRQAELDAVHLVFFNHFLGPALIFPGLHTGLSTKQQATLQNIAYRFVGFASQWRNEGTSTSVPSHSLSRCSSSDSLLGTFEAKHHNPVALHRRYQDLLTTICSSPAMISSYDASGAPDDVDCELMAMCLMNIHSVLDSNFVAFRRRLINAQVRASPEDDRLPRITRLLKALSFPIADIHTLVAYAQCELENNPLLWNGFGFQDWQDRAADHPSTTDGSPVWTNTSVLESSNAFPQEVDYLAS